MLITYVCGSQSSLIPVIDTHVTGRYGTLRDVTGRYGTLRDVTWEGQYEGVFVLCIIRIRIVLNIIRYYVLYIPGNLHPPQAPKALNSCLMSWLVECEHENI